MKDTDSMRLQANIFLDKVVYRPNDVMFIEVYILDAFNKTPQISNQLYFSRNDWRNQFKMTINDDQKS